MSSVDYRNLLDRLESGEFDVSVAHNAATAIAILGGTTLALKDPVTFDPREDYWYLPERRLFVAFFANKWPYWPKGEDETLLKFATLVATHFEAARQKQLIVVRTVHYDDVGGLPAILAPLRKHIETLPPVDEWERLQKKKLGAQTPVAALQGFLDGVVGSNYEEYENALAKNLRWFPFLGARDGADVERRQKFFVAFAHAVMSTNAYKTAGAQYFGPIVGNTSTSVFLECLKGWRVGKRLDELPLLALGNDDKSTPPSDRSHTSVVRELWGFLNLQHAPFYNKRAENYASITGVSDPEEATRIIGAATRDFLRKNPAETARATAHFRRVLESAKRANDKPFAVARRIPEAQDHTSFDAKLLEEIASAGKGELLQRSDEDQAAILLHLALDANTYQSSISDDPSRTSLAAAISSAEREDSAAGTTYKGTLRDAPRVWVYAPGPGADHWQQDHDEGAASIDWRRVGDISSYDSEDELRHAIDADEKEEGDASRSARVCWQFANEMKFGDPIIARKGRSMFVGVGIVDGEYRHEPSRPYPHIVKVRWLWRGEHKIKERNSLAISTLVESSRRKTLLAELDALLSPTLGPALNADGQARDAEAPQPEPYTLAHAASDLFVGERWLEHQLRLLRRKKNIILKGPPGVGKTYVAQRLAYLLMGEKANERLELVQFHPSYTYEQFVRGYRPEAGGGFVIEDGPLYRLAERAKGDPDTAYLLVIDEINRGHLGKILGEAMLLLESDKRSEKWAVRLAYPNPAAAVAGEEERFFLPPNLYVIGTMNTADRSLAVVDYALRRRFAFVSVAPAFQEPAFRAHLNGLPNALADAVIGRVGRLNEMIRADPSLGDGFQVGHSYFCTGDGEANPPWLADPQAWWDDVVAHEVLPLLEEYWSDAPDSVQAARQLLGLALA